jgi:hypothetical protein
MEILEKLTELLGRKPELIQTSFKGKRGFFPLYFNYATRNDASKLFAETKEQVYQNWYDYLTQNGGTNGIKTTDQQSDSEENTGP